MFFKRDAKIEGLVRELAAAQARVASQEQELTRLRERLAKAEAKADRETDERVAEMKRFVDRTLVDMGRRPVYGLVDLPAPEPESRERNLEIVRSGRAGQRASFMARHLVTDPLRHNLGIGERDGSKPARGGDPAAEAADGPAEELRDGAREAAGD